MGSEINYMLDLQKIPSKQLRKQLVDFVEFYLKKLHGFIQLSITTFGGFKMGKKKTKSSKKDEE